MSIALIADATSRPINGLQVVPKPTAINLVHTDIYGDNMLNIAIDYNNGPDTWMIKNPVAEIRLSESQLRNLVFIVRHWDS